MSQFIERQLFSVRLTGDNSFAVILPPATWSMPDGKARTFKETHITAHVGRDVEAGFGHKVKRSGRTFEDERFDSSLIVRDDNKRGIIFPIYSSFCGINGSPIWKSRRGDNKVELVGVTGIEESICYTIFASSTNIELPIIQGFSKYSNIFGSMRFTLYLTFFHANNDFINIAGKETPPYNRLNDEPWKAVGQNENPIAFAESMPAENIEVYLQTTHGMIALDYVKFARDHGIIAHTFSKDPGNFGRWPSVEDKFHVEYGIFSRSRNDVYAAPRTVDGLPKTPEQMNYRGVINTFQNPMELFNSLSESAKQMVSPETVAALHKLSGENKD